MTDYAGLYLHIPFCQAKCTYCSFITGSYEDLLAQRYLKALAAEVRASAASLTPAKRSVDTIYFGGGTPSIIAPAALEQLLEVCHECFDVAADAEITVEMNPSDIDLARLRSYREMGINRASVGVQSFIDTQLRAMGRDHSAADAFSAVDKLRSAGFDNISIDLIAGLPEQTLEQWHHNLAQACSLAPEHLSIYLLEIKEGTTLYAQIRSGQLQTPDEDLAAEMYEMLLDETAATGYQHYEISNFARIKSDQLRYSHHNIKYWLDIPYFGYGVSAHSYNGRERYWNVKSTHEYITRIEQSGEAVAERIELSPYDQAREAFMLQLRLMTGVDLANFQIRYGFDLANEYHEELVELAAAGLLETDQGRLRLTRRGILLSNEVFLLFV
ncbi:MAG: radical SAM family heme chaperone HemW [Acidobacteriota bacterium]